MNEKEKDEEVPTVIHQGLYLVLAAVRGGAAQRGAQEHEEQREHLKPQHRTETGTTESPVLVFL